jgi:ribosome-associated protein
MIRISGDLEIDEAQFIFRASRSSGPGGQHVNKTSTRITLFFDVVNSPSLSDQQKHRILTVLAGRIDKNGVLSITSQASRSQFANKAAVTQRFIELLAAALRPARKRKKTAIPRAAREKRLESKRRRSQIKHLRSAKEPE